MIVYNSIPPELSVPAVTVDDGVRTLANETKPVAPNVKGIIITHFHFCLTIREKGERCKSKNSRSHSNSFRL